MKIFNKFVVGTSILAVTAVNLCGNTQKTPSVSESNAKTAPITQTAKAEKQTTQAMPQKFGPYKPSDPEYVLEQLWKDIKNYKKPSAFNLKIIMEMQKRYTYTEEYTKLFNLINDQFCSNVSDKADCQKVAKEQLGSMIQEYLFKIILFSLAAGFNNQNPIKNIYSQNQTELTSIITLEMKTGLKIDFWVLKETDEKTSLPHDNYIDMTIIYNPHENIFKWVIPCLVTEMGCYPDLIKEIYGEDADTDITKIEKPLENILNNWK